MLLNKLNESLKPVFLEICIHAARADNTFDDIEKIYIYEYAREMGIEPSVDCKRTLGDCYAFVNKYATEFEKRVIVFEIMALMLSNNDYDDLEKSFISNLCDSVSFPKEQLPEMEKACTDLIVAYKNALNIIQAN